MGDQTTGGRTLVEAAGMDVGLLLKSAFGRFCSAAPPGRFSTEQRSRLNVPLDRGFSSMGGLPSSTSCAATCFHKKTPHDP